MKKDKLYRIILLSWAALVLVFSYNLMLPLLHAYQISALTFSVVLISTLFVIYFWLNGIKDIVYTFYYYLFAKQLRIPYKSFDGTPLVELLYCTCNDFNAENFEKCITQDYSNYRIVILDDSSNKIYKRKIDVFAKKHNIKIVRRKDRVGYKAGNLNNYLKTSKADFFVILDSDEVIPNDFITKALPYFNNGKIAVLQANHIAAYNKNSFMDRFADGVESHWNAYQTIKNNYGFLSFLGHGAMIRKTAYDLIGGFPNLVAEDLCFSIELRNKGYYVRFAPEIICHEEYPVNYMAFKKRHAKWTMGNMEFIRAYTKKIIKSNMRWFEKLDIILFTYNLPLSVVFISYLIINIIVLPILHFSLNYSLDMLVPTLIFLAAPMLNDVIYFRTTRKKRIMLLYTLSAFLLYGSMFYISFKSSLKALFTQAVFIVTPKLNSQISMKQALVLNYEELFFALFLCGISLYFLHSLMSVLLIVFPSFCSIYLTRLGNKENLLPEDQLIDNRP